jgi:hypothetical protein
MACTIFCPECANLHRSGAPCTGQQGQGTATPRVSVLLSNELLILLQSGTDFAITCYGTH